MLSVPSSVKKGNPIIVNAKIVIAQKERAANTGNATQ